MAIWGSSDGHFVQAVELASGKERWRAPSENIVWGSAAVAGGMVFVGEGSGLLHVLDLKSGAERWRWRAGGGLFSSPVVADSTLYLGSDDGGVYAVALTAGPALQRAVFWDSAGGVDLLPRPRIGAQLAARSRLHGARCQWRDEVA